MKKKILVSGIKPTGQLHIGNYFGAMKQFVDLQNTGEFEIYIFLANYHALNSMQDREGMKKYSFDLICAYLAIGLDPKKVTLYKQSDIPEFAELTWIFNTQTTMPYLMRAHAFKDAEAKSKEISVGTFNYPILMAADILMYDADIVPVGKDQKQHVEMAREIGQKFNRIYGVDVFKDPQEYIVEDVETVPGIDGQKMSKSYNNVIPLFGTDEEMVKAIMSIVTDSKSPEDSKNPDEVLVYQMYKLVASEDEREKMRQSLEKGGLGYGEAKKELLRKILEYFKPMRERYEYFQKNPRKVESILKKGAKQIRKKTEVKMKMVREAAGL
jgi:tryptophanyl-tRNA synthetase